MQTLSCDFPEVRMTQVARSSRFHGDLGFALGNANASDRVAGKASRAVVRLTLILNGIARANGESGFLDVVPRRPGDPDENRLKFNELAPESLSS